MNTQAVGIQVKARNRRRIVQWLATLMLVGTLLLQPLVGYAQATDSVDTQPYRLFLPMAAGSDAGNEVEQAEVEQAETQMEAEMALSDAEQGALDDAILNAPLPDTATVSAASVNQIFTVTKADDTNDGLCDSDCSLREALNAAAADPLTYDRIDLPAGLYELSLGTLTLINAKLIGADTKTTIITHIAGDGDLLEITGTAPASATQQIEKVTLRDGRDAITYMKGTLTLVSVLISNNGGDGVTGTDQAGQLFVFNSIIEGHDTGIKLRQQVSGHIEHSVLRKNVAGVSARHFLTIIDSTITQNETGIKIRGGAKAKIRNSAITHNRAEGIELSNGDVTISNSTITYNTPKNPFLASSFGGKGGLVLQDGSVAHLDFVTIASNNVNSIGAGIVVDANPRNLLVLRNSIVANNYREDHTTADCIGEITSAGYNLIENTVGCTITGDTTGNIYGQDPKLVRLIAPKGSPAHYVPAQTSPVIDVIPAEQCGQMNIDQRYLSRPRDGNNDRVALCDIGAVER